MDLNPYRSPQVDPAPPPHVWKPQYTSAAIGSTALVMAVYALIYTGGQFILEFVNGATLDAKKVAGLVVSVLMVAFFARWVWRALKYGERP